MSLGYSGNVSEFASSAEISLQNGLINRGACDFIVTGSALTPQITLAGVIDSGESNIYIFWSKGI
jgi:hypothetical protein